MSSQKSKVFAPLTLVIAGMGLIVVVLTGAATFIGGTKIRPLFGMPEGGRSMLPQGQEEAPDASTPDAGDAGLLAAP